MDIKKILLKAHSEGDGRLLVGLGLMFWKEIAFFLMVESCRLSGLNPIENINWNHEKYPSFNWKSWKTIKCLNYYGKFEKIFIYYRKMKFIGACKQVSKKKKKASQLLFPPFFVLTAPMETRSNPRAPPPGPNRPNTTHSNQSSNHCWKRDINLDTFL